MTLKTNSVEGPGRQTTRRFPPAPSPGATERPSAQAADRLQASRVTCLAVSASHFREGQTARLPHRYCDCMSQHDGRPPSADWVAQEMEQMLRECNALRSDSQTGCYGCRSNVGALQPRSGDGSAASA
jgi:hypothetical protein